MMIINVSDSSTRYGQKEVNELVDTPRSLFESLGVRYERGQTSLNGTILTPGQMDMTFAALGVAGIATLSSIVKGDGAAITVNVSDSGTRYGGHTVNELTDTPRSLFERLGVAYQRGQTSLNGTILTPGQMDMTFSALGVAGLATLSSIVKGDGAI